MPPKWTSRKDGSGGDCAVRSQSADGRTDGWTGRAGARAARNHRTQRSWDGTIFDKGARICSAVVRGSAVRHGLPKAGPVRDIELRPTFQTGMIEALMMHRQSFPQKKFLFFARNFLWRR